ncbi:MAG: hypothetical protein K2X70_12375 [Candidatus Obscuribacterales bacterium]|jgi:hypothetical protein|nr:hypothetical protein [Candidatus Obscuribacterales bacterium]
MSSNKFFQELDKNEKIDNAEEKDKKYGNQHIDTDKVMEFICKPVPKLLDKDILDKGFIKDESANDKIDKRIEKYDGDDRVYSKNKNGGSDGSSHGEQGDRKRPPIEERWPGHERKVEHDNNRAGGARSAGGAHGKEFLDFNAPLNVKGFDAAGAAGH